MAAASVRSLVTSASKATQAPPSLAANPAVSCAEARSRSTASTFAPSWAKRSTVARPLPKPSPGLWPAPTTMAIFPARRMANSPVSVLAIASPVEFRLPPALLDSPPCPGFHSGHVRGRGLQGGFHDRNTILEGQARDDGRPQTHWPRRGHPCALGRVWFGHCVADRPFLRGPRGDGRQEGQRAPRCRRP